MSNMEKEIKEKEKEDKEEEEKPTFNNADEFYEQFKEEFKKLPKHLQHQLLYHHIESEARDKVKKELDEVIKSSPNRVERMRAKLQKKLLKKQNK